MKIAVLASGNGSNFEALVKNNIPVDLLICNDEQAYALTRAKKMNIPYQLINDKDFENNKLYNQKLFEFLKQTLQADDLIILAGYMKLIPAEIIDYFPNIVNIHPSLLPAFKGLNAIEQALVYGVKVTGVTIHYIDSKMDEGVIIAQQAVTIDDDENFNSLLVKINAVEHQLFPKTIKRIIKEKYEKSID